MTSFDTFVGIFITAAGACFGSFGNVIIDRWPKQMSIVKPRSHCFKCKRPIAFYDNIPILSWIILRGKCRKCGTKISPRSLVVELLSACLFLSLYLKLGLSWFFLEATILCWGMLVASVIDLDIRILPDKLTLPGIVVGLLGGALNPERNFLNAILGMLLGGGFLWLIAFVYTALRKEEGMGGGDIKLLAWIGAVLGWKSVPFTILTSSVLGSVVGLGFAFKNKSGMKTSIPFGPFLSAAAFIYILVGDSIINAYLKFFFPFME